MSRRFSISSARPPRAAIPSSTFTRIPHELRPSAPSRCWSLLHATAGGRVHRQRCGRTSANSFGLDLGIADGSSWAEVANRRLRRPSRRKTLFSFVSMIDPATGTGTFLVEWLRREDFFKPVKRRVTGVSRCRTACDARLRAHARALCDRPLGRARTPWREVDGDGADILLADTLSHAATELKLGRCAIRSLWRARWRPD